MADVAPPAGKSGRTALRPRASPPRSRSPASPIEIASKALAGKNHFEIRLDPPELGRIEVRLDVDRDGHVTSRLIADRSDTLDLLRRDASGLERALQDAGLKTSDNGLQFSLRDQTAGRQQQNNTPTPGAAQIVVQDSALPVNDAVQRNYSRLAGLARRHRYYGLRIDHDHDRAHTHLVKQSRQWRIRRGRRVRIAPKSPAISRRSCSC